MTDKEKIAELETKVKELEKALGETILRAGELAGQSAVYKSRAYWAALNAGEYPSGLY